MSLRDGVSVFKPEVKNISEQVNAVGIMLNGIKPGNNSSLAYETALMIGNSEVEVRCKVDFFIS